MGSANERRRYIGTPHPIGWDYTLNNPWKFMCFCTDIPASKWGSTVQLSECHYNAVQYNRILHISLQWRVEYESEIESTKDTPYLALTGELWCIFCENFGENWLRYNGTALFFPDLFRQVIILLSIIFTISFLCAETLECIPLRMTCCLPWWRLEWWLLTTPQNQAKRWVKSMVGIMAELPGYGVLISVDTRRDARTLLTLKCATRFYQI